MASAVYVASSWKNEHQPAVIEAHADVGSAKADRCLYAASVLRAEANAIERAAAVARSEDPNGGPGA